MPHKLALLSRRHMSASPSLTPNLTFLHSRHFQPFLPQHSCTQSLEVWAHTTPHAMMAFPLPHSHAHLKPYLSSSKPCPVCVCVCVLVFSRIHWSHAARPRRCVWQGAERSVGLERVGLHSGWCSCSLLAFLCVSAWCSPSLFLSLWLRVFLQKEDRTCSSCWSLSKMVKMLKIDWQWSLQGPNA